MEKYHFKEDAISESDKPSGSSIGVGSAAIGAIAIILVNSLVENLVARQILLALTPGLSIFAVFLMSSAFVWILKFTNDRALQRDIREARKAMLLAMDNPRSSEAHKLIMRDKLEKLEINYVDRLSDRVIKRKEITREDALKTYSSSQQ